MNKLIEKINSISAKIGVVGLGYVGLPLAVEIAKIGYKVIGVDVDCDRINDIQNGSSYIGDVNNSDLKEVVKNNNLLATRNYKKLESTDIIIICVPTPLDEYHQPNTKYIKSATEEISNYLTNEKLIILESTTYPGTTEEIIKPILEKDDLICGNDFYLAFSPERVDPGNKKYNTKNTPKVVGGVTSKCTKIASEFYNNVLTNIVHKVSSPAIAEMEKILENTFRNINIALVNEMAILAEKMGIDIWEVIEAAKTKPYGYMAFYPGPGLGGHCIPIDPFYLTWKAREYDYHTRLIELAGEINNSMPDFVVDKLMKVLNEFKKPLNGSKILILGVAYKKDINDLRESPSLKIINLLEKNGAKILYNDPFIDNFKLNNKEYQSEKLSKKLLSEVDVALIATDHSIYDIEKIVNNSQIVFDTRNATKSIKSEKIYKL